MKQFNLVVCGGTFDHFHKGHENLLSYALSLGGRLIVGLVSDDYIKSAKRKAQSVKLIEGYEVRKKSLEKFLSQKKVLGRVEIIKIDDLFGPTLSKDLLIDAIVVSEETKKGAEIINGKRKELGLKDLRILVAPLVLTEDGRIISSARIRNGEIGKNGQLYVNPLWLKNDLILPQSLRPQLKEPFGEIVKEIKADSGDSSVATVGDITTKKLNDLDFKHKVSIIDFNVCRKKEFDDIGELGFAGSEKTIGIKNPAGRLTSDLFKVCKKAWKEKERIIILVKGEEDIAVLPLVLTAPLGTVIFYGQPDQGLVKVLVSEESKDRAYELVSRFQILDSSLCQAKLGFVQNDR